MVTCACSDYIEFPAHPEGDDEEDTNSLQKDLLQDMWSWLHYIINKSPHLVLGIVIRDESCLTKLPSDFDASDQQDILTFKYFLVTEEMFVRGLLAISNLCSSPQICVDVSYIFIML